MLTVTAPDGKRATFLVELKRLVERRDVAQIMERLNSNLSPDVSYPLILSRYLSPSVREAVAERGGSYIDATGNIRIEATRPAIFVLSEGLDRDPWRSQQGRPRGTLKGTPAARVIRTLVDNRNSWTVRELVAESSASTGATYRVLEYLQQEELIERGDSNRYRVRSWRALLQAWSKDYGFLRSNKSASFIDPRGIGNLAAQMAIPRDFEIAVTGSLAAEEWQPYAQVKAAMVYVESMSAAAKAWGLTPTETGGNVLLAEPESDFPFRRTVTSRRNGLRIAAPSQVAVDLLTGSGRNPSEATQLMNWMEQHESAWRR
jgi:hypothetical protein